MWPFKPNDWKIIQIETQEFEMYMPEYNTRRTTRQICKLMYSALRNKYKIIFDGYRPMDGNSSTNAYKRCLEKQMELEKDNNSLII